MSVHGEIAHAQLAGGTRRAHTHSTCMAMSNVRLQPRAHAKRRRTHAEPKSFVNEQTTCCRRGEVRRVEGEGAGMDGTHDHAHAGGETCTDLVFLS